jgi:hypothetical protein
MAKTAVSTKRKVMNIDVDVLRAIEDMVRDGEGSFDLPTPTLRVSRACPICVSNNAHLSDGFMPDRRKSSSARTQQR